MALSQVQPHCRQFSTRLTPQEIETLANDPSLTLLQTSEPPEPAIWKLLNDELFARRPDVKLRVYGFYASKCDLSFVRRLSNLRRFSADCLQEAEGVDAIADIPHLEELGLGIFSLQTFGVLERVRPGLRTLALGATRSKKPDLAVLARFPELRTLYIEGHRKHIEVLAQLEHLEDVTLRSVTTPNLDYLNGLRNLWSLDIKLGGIKDLDAIAGLPGLKYLELWQVLGLSEISVIETLPNLQHLFLQSLPQVTSLPDLSRATALRRVTLDNMKGIKNLAPLQDAPALEQLIIIDATHLQPEDLIPAFRNPSLKQAVVGLGSDKRNNSVDQLRRQHRIADMEMFHPFEFR